MAIIPPPSGPGSPRVPPYPGGQPNGGGTGGSSGGSSGVSGQGVFVPTSYGGVYAVQQVTLYAVYNAYSGQMEFRTWNPLVPPNDPLLGSSYTWKMEDVATYRNPTLRRIAVTYRDLGVVAMVWTATAENQGKVQSKSIPKTWGNIVPTYRLMATVVDILCTGQLIQVSVSRAANAGPLGIVKITMAIEVEEKTL